VLLSPTPPIEQNDDSDDKQDANNHPEGVHHGPSPSSNSENTTNTTQTAVPVRINDQDAACCVTNCPRTSAANTRFASSRTVSHDLRPRYPYDVAPDGQRFLINTLVGDSFDTRMTVVTDWTADLEN